MKLCHNIRFILSFIVVVLCLINIPGLPLAIASDDPDSIVKQRQLIMKNVKKTIGTLSASLKNNASQEELINAADAFLSAVSSQATIAAFKINTHRKSSVKTTATEKIWMDWERFQQALTDMENGAKEIQTLAQNGLLTSRDQLGETLKTCSFCHRTAGYRN